MDDIITTKGQLLKFITDCATEYVKEANLSLSRNKHMHNYNCLEYIDQVVVDALIVDFVNFIAYRQGLDWGLYTKDL